LIGVAYGVKSANREFQFRSAERCSATPSNCQRLQPLMLEMIALTEIHQQPPRTGSWGKRNSQKHTELILSHGVQPCTIRLMI